MAEQWKPIKGYGKDYLISSSGRVKSTRTGDRILKNQNHSRGYQTVMLWAGGKYKTHLLHRLVADGFLGGSGGKTQVNHKDGNKKNNKKSNLEWCNNSENQKHAWASGLRK